MTECSALLIEGQESWSEIKTPPPALDQRERALDQGERGLDQRERGLR